MIVRTPVSILLLSRGEETLLDTVPARRVVTLARTRASHSRTLTSSCSIACIILPFHFDSVRFQL